MFEITKEAIASQYEAAFLTLQECIDQCPDETWCLPVANNPFCQSIFHALFFCDLYLGIEIVDMKRQVFHSDNADMFRDYEELEFRKPDLLYQRADIQKYLDFCREKAKRKLQWRPRNRWQRSPEFHGMIFRDSKCISTISATSNIMPPN